MTRSLWIKVQRAVVHQMRDTALGLKGFPGDRGQVGQLGGNHFAKDIVFGQGLFEVIKVGQLAFFSHTVNQQNFVKTLVDFRVLRNAQERRQARTRRQ